MEVFRNTPLTVVFFFLAFGIVEIDLQFPSRFITAVAALRCTRRRSSPRRCGPASTPCRPARPRPPGPSGWTSGQTLTHVVLPQAFRTVVPPLGNVWIALAKNTSIAAGFAVTELAAALVRLSNQNADKLLAVFLAIVVGLPAHHPAVGLADRRHRATDGDPAMSTSTVLFDVPGPAGPSPPSDRHAHRPVLVLLALIGLALWRLGVNGQLEPARWAVLFDPNSGVPQAFGNALVNTLQVAAVAMVAATRAGRAARLRAAVGPPLGAGAGHRGDRVLPRRAAADPDPVLPAVPAAVGLAASARSAHSPSA